MTKKQLIQVIGSGEKTYLYFYSTWCSSCKKVESLVDKVTLPIVKINGTENEDLLNAFDIEFYPTIVEINGTKKRTFAGATAVNNLLK
tara:strand:- start:152 stop:415 length:264 start_codon:yes stop_codon:yes gene_type:complete